MGIQRSKQNTRKCESEFASRAFPCLVNFLSFYFIQKIKSRGWLSVGNLSSSPPPSYLSATVTSWPSALLHRLETPHPVPAPDLRKSSISNLGPNHVWELQPHSRPEAGCRFSSGYLGGLENLKLKIQCGPKLTVPQAEVNANPLWRN